VQVGRSTKCKCNAPIKIWLKIFDSIIQPILLYGSEISGPLLPSKYISWDKTPTKLHQEFCKNIVNVQRNSKNHACRAELGRVTLLLPTEKGHANCGCTCPIK
jgi:hypothetical protein